VTLIISFGDMRDAFQEIRASKMFRAILMGNVGKQLFRRELQRAYDDVNNEVKVEWAPKVAMRKSLYAGEMKQAGREWRSCPRCDWCVVRSPEDPQEDMTCHDCYRALTAQQNQLNLEWNQEYRLLAWTDWVCQFPRK
jgi:hypothetical protein